MKGWKSSTDTIMEIDLFKLAGAWYIREVIVFHGLYMHVVLRNVDSSCVSKFRASMVDRCNPGVILLMDDTKHTDTVMC